MSAIQASLDRIVRNMLNEYSKDFPDMKVESEHYEGRQYLISVEDWDLIDKGQRNSVLLDLMHHANKDDTPFKVEIHGEGLGIPKHQVLPWVAIKVSYAVNAR